MQQSLLSTLLSPAALRTATQPIVALRDGLPHPVAYECLTRGPAGSNFENAQVLFDYVRLKRDEPRVDRACVATALQSVQFADDVAISINVHAATLARDPDFVTFLLSMARIDPRRIIIEIVEHATAWLEPMLRAVAALREAGVRIALDDIGNGQSNLRMILDLAPEIFKIDRYFIDGCHVDAKRLAIIRSMCDLARAFDATVVAEGVEDARDVPALVECGVSWFQGYLFGRPR